MPYSASIPRAGFAPSSVQSAFAALLLLAVATGCAHAPVATASGDVDDCRVGAYRLADGRSFDVGHAKAGLRWRLRDGTTGLLVGPAGAETSTLGATGRPDGRRLVFDCTAGRVVFDGIAETREVFAATDTEFVSGDTRLAGRLVLPPGDAPVPLVVLVHGSEATSARRFEAWQRMLPAAGVAAFVYDKRGTGNSGGVYTQDFHRLARDAAAAMGEARRLAGARVSTTTYAGASQGGWVVPLAQGIVPADRVIVSYGLTVSPLEENRSEALQQLAARGHGAAALAAAADVVDATGMLMASGFRDGFDNYARAWRRHRKAPWFGQIEGEFSGAILRYRPGVLRLVAPVARRRSAQGTPWTHDPLPALRAVDAPMLWVLAGDDLEAPPAQTRADLLAMRAAGRPVTLLEFPATDHGIVEYETTPGGARRTTRVAEGYFDAVLDFARSGRLDRTTYGTSRRDGHLGTD